MYETTCTYARIADINVFNSKLILLNSSFKFKTHKRKNTQGRFDGLNSEVYYYKHVTIQIEHTSKSVSFNSNCPKSTVDMLYAMISL